MSSAQAPGGARCAARPFRIAVLISGEGSNLQALLDSVHGEAIAIVGVASSRAEARGLERAEGAGVETAVFSLAEEPDRVKRDEALAGWLEERRVELVVLAGFMELLTPAFIRRFAGRIVNVHPALLPAFPGLGAIEQAVEHGVKVAGVTVHFVTTDLDAGPIIVQHSVPVLDDDTADTLAARILVEEHRAYPEAVKLVLDGSWRIDGRRFVRTAASMSSPSR